MSINFYPTILVASTGLSAKQGVSNDPQKLIKKAEHLIRMGNFGGAIDQIETALTLILTPTQKDKINDCLSYIVSKLEKQPTHTPKRMLVLAKAYLLLDRKEEAYYQFRQCLEYPGVSNEAQGYVDKIVQSLISDNLHLAGLFFTEGEIDEAISCYQSILEFVPDSVEAHVQLALLYSQIPDHFEKAIVEAELALSYDPDNRFAYVALLTAYTNTFQYDKVLSLVEDEHLLEKYPNDASINYLYGKTLFDYVPTQPATREILGQMLENDSIDFSAQQLSEINYFMSFAVYFDVNAVSNFEENRKTIIDLLENAVRLNPHYQDAWVLLSYARYQAGAFLVGQNRKIEALNYLNDALEAAEQVYKNGSHDLRYLRYCGSNEETTETINKILYVLLHEYSETEVKLLLGRACMLCGDYEAAVNYFSSFKNDNGEIPEEIQRKFDYIATLIEVH
ncbi:MAG: hypothetical protein KKF07_02765 [Candidatus Margulisbacteria bacterium]|nr:hypothetical protein [Candidatus Margulisiibacteriota bacterium]MBU1728698.1 hypothetical protein [Candidatus Margulisiibacteriota bacterium]MBU1955149.1 hypothetical protein [Candidatus Margulisiibacteriota bacterium]